jgi:hypothetical protein
MSDQKKKNEPKVYRITETIFVNYEVVAASEKDALEHYQAMDNKDWQDLVADSASHSWDTPEVQDEEEYDHANENGVYPITDKAKAWISKNIE